MTDQLSIDELYELVDSQAEDLMMMEVALTTIKALTENITGWKAPQINEIATEALNQLDTLALEFELDE